MPIYEYECPEHGLFEELRPMLRSAEGAECPRCRASAPRVLSATRTSVVSRAARLAHARNELSQHAPEHTCHPHAQRQPRTQPERAQRPSAYRGQRPWVLEHG